MASTLDILSRAVADAGTAAALARDLHIDQSTFTQARKRGRLSPTLAGTLAARLGLDPEHWIAVAALEAEPPTALRDRLRRSLDKVRKS
jgi:plasmid maintenance system antidote protein VapI